MTLKNNANSKGKIYNLQLNVVLVGSAAAAVLSHQKNNIATGETSPAITRRHRKTACFTASPTFSYFRSKSKNGCSQWSWLLLDLQVHGLLPSTGQQRAGISLLSCHGPILHLFLGHHEEKCQAQRRIHRKEGSNSANCDPPSWTGSHLFFYLWTVWVHQCLWKGAEATHKDEAW